MKNTNFLKPVFAASAAAVTTLVINIALIAPLLQLTKWSFFVNHLNGLFWSVIAVGLTALYVCRQRHSEQFFAYFAVFSSYLSSTFFLFVDKVAEVNIKKEVQSNVFIPAGEAPEPTESVAWYWANILSHSFVQYLILSLLLAATLYCLKQIRQSR
ncbi:hypothetical protein RJ45_06920 [Photobacterium gaetbulicola]|uniref:Uncharacterized protein n=1 Tax=Photobacterium gaetbulicola TaxID=1295392 RepID=A0A0B9GHV5_9GAMM|nr:hypothetical protein [Photobacterium gaetbulicola]KHT64360.1 hypothetical protein RJ45_06920 [Photobacterium gaetbulicola]